MWNRLAGGSHLSDSRWLDRPDQVTDRFATFLFQQDGKLIDEVRGERRIVEVRSSDLDSRGAADQELHHVVDRLDSTDANDWRLDRLSNLPDDPECQRLDGRPA